MSRIVRTDDGVRLAVETRGPATAPPLLFLNSIGCDRRLWDAQASSLAAERFCILFDARGHGASDAPAGDYTIERLARDACAILDALEIARVDVCGLSLGGVVGQWLAIHRPGRIRGVVLANTASRIGSAEAWETRRRTVLDEGMGAVADMAMQRFFSADFRRGAPGTVAAFRTTLLATSAEGYAGCCAALRECDLTVDVGRITAPTLVIGGENDVSTPPVQAEALAAAVSGARLTLLPAAHLSNVEQPDAFTRALAQHLETA